jgi:hypothetical protein
MSLKKDTKAASGILTENQMAQMSPYSNGGSSNSAGQSRKAEQSKKDKAANKSAKSKSNNALARAKKEIEAKNRQLNDLRTRERQRKEYTPTAAVREDGISLVYTGMVAGKTQTRQVPIIEKNPAVAQLKPLLTPIVAVLNAALREKQLEETPVIKDDGSKAVDQDNNPVLHATALTKARYAYSQLLGNPDVLKKLEALGQAIDKAYVGLELPSKVRTVSYSKKTSSYDQKIASLMANPAVASAYDQSVSDDTDDYLP